ncbi:TPA: hypothetical protein N0F65_006540 [Lagenidium giganteum]|uniref:RNA polymerase II subunit A C-terminal domain phosphatase n=1 Tax=Lagenidium giganteum TaxID=4803 RepID=A0AAV2YJN7_9STRA|nr:TPA: hypothetical protein N0F65_006540 [Lagenidium giganteum]
MTEPDHLRRKHVACARALVETLAWSVADGSAVDKGQVLGTVGVLEQGNQQQLTSPCRGTFHVEAPADSSATNGATALKDEEVLVAYVEYCTHPFKNNRTCMMCLAVVDEADELDEELKSVNVISHGQVIRLNVEEAKKFDTENIRRQLTAKKLSLVLDLDHTLLHAVRVSDVVGEIPQTDDTHFFFIPGLVGQQHVVKLRPGLETFLQELSVGYDLFIYTHGTRLYAEQIAQIIDPKGTFFQHRIVARTDTPDMLHKSLKLLFPSCDDSMILVLDDRIDVWKENEGNVFLIEPYHYFQCTAEINNAAGRGVLEIADESSGNGVDSHLTHAMNVLKGVHRMFYESHKEDGKAISVEEQMAGNGMDVKALLSQQKRTVLKGCHIVFSGVFPIDGRRGPETHYLWKLAAELGAVPSVTMKDFPITHLVIDPRRLGTQKHVQARAIPNIKVVVPEWILRSARTWTRADESEFLADEWRQRQEQVAQTRAAAQATEATSPPAPSAAATPNPDQAVAPESAADGNSVGNGESVAAAAVPPASLPPPSSSSPPTTGNETTATQEPTIAKSAPKEKKGVSFAAELEEVREIESQEGDSPAVAARPAGPSQPLRHRRAVVRRTNRPVRSAPLPPKMGTVASGGTFDFLSKITTLGANSRGNQELKKPVASRDTKPATSAPAVPAPTKEIDDDAFLRLIEAEERENEDEQKRKLSSTDVKDVLSSRRTKKAKQEVEATLKDGSDNDTGDDDVRCVLLPLDDLEDDILGDL